MRTEAEWKNDMVGYVLEKIIPVMHIYLSAQNCALFFLAGSN